MADRLLLKNAHVFYKNSLRKLDIYCEGGVIIEVATDIKITDAQVLDLSNKYVLPGAIDSHVHFNDPGFIHREDFFTGSKASLKGGITTVIDMPSSNIPQVKNIELLNAKLDIIREKSNCDFSLFGGVTQDEVEKKQLQETIRLYDEGVCGIKLFMSTSNPAFKHLNNGHLLETIKHFSNTGMLLVIHAEDFDICDYNIRVSKLKNRNYPLAWVEARPAKAEINAVQTAITLAKDHNIRLHFVHISTKKALEEIKLAKKHGMDITCETNPYYLEFTQDDIDKFGNLSKITPPLRSREDRISLWQGINSGHIDTLSSNHSPYEYHTEKEFDGANIWNVYSGTPETEFLFPYMFSEGFLKHRIDLIKLVDTLCVNPSKRFGLYPKKGLIQIGSDADFVVIDPEKEMIVKNENMASKSKFTLFDNFTFKGLFEKTFLRGNLVYTSEQGLIKERSGRYIKRIRY